LSRPLENGPLLRRLRVDPPLVSGQRPWAGGRRIREGLAGGFVVAGAEGRGGSDRAIEVDFMVGQPEPKR
jgi:hypothetical protein